MFNAVRIVWSYIHFYLTTGVFIRWREILWPSLSQKINYGTPLKHPCDQDYSYCVHDNASNMKKKIFIQSCCIKSEHSFSWYPCISTNAIKYCDSKLLLQRHLLREMYGYKEVCFAFINPFTLYRYKNFILINATLIYQSKNFYINSNISFHQTLNHGCISIKSM